MKTTRMKKIVSIRDDMASSMVGGKFEKQKRMADAGLPIPPFFCMTAAFYDEVFAQIRGRVEEVVAGMDAGDHESVRRASAAITLLFQGLELTPKQEAAILGRFDGLFPTGTLVSVRSSMIGHRIEESEDSIDNPFAGISETFLYVPRDRVIERLKICWASGFAQEAILYRHNQGMSLTGFSVAVGVQRMVFGERSFVLFTCNPKTASRDTVIIAGYGIGEGVVQERVPVDHYFKNFNTGVIEAAVARKTSLLTMDEKKGHGIAEKKVPAPLQKRQCLSDEEIGLLEEYGRKIETIFGHPQDIEGTFTADGTLYFLQSRPVALDYSRQKVWTNANVTESFPGVTTALTFSFSRFFYRVIFYDCYRMLKYPPDLLHDQHEYLDRMIGFLKGRVYYNLTSFYHLHSLSPIFPIFRAYWEKMMGFLSSYQTKERGLFGRLAGTIAAAARFIASLVNFLYQFAVHQKKVRAYHRWWEGLIAPLRGKDYSSEDLVRAVNTFHRVWIEVGNHWGVTLTNDTYLPFCYGFIEKLFAKWKLDGDASLMSDLLCGGEELLSVEIILSSVSLAEKVRADAPLAKLFAKNDPKAIWRMIEQGKIDPGFAGEVKKHLHFYGDRGLQELKMEQPNIRHEPWVLLRMVQEYARTGITVRELREKEDSVRREAEERLAKRLRARPLRRFVLNRLLGTVRRLIRNRENSRYCRSELFGLSKNIFRGIGEQFARARIIARPDDIFHLAMDEIVGYIDGTGVTENLRALVEIRKREFREHQKYETPMQITTIGPVRDNALAAEIAGAGKGGVLKGIGSSAGRVRGTARVVIDPTREIDMTDDMILIARETDPGWLFLMLASRGIVVERGSMLSHTAITGRKFGIPTIVSLPGATAIIPDGAKVEIDGAAGTVTLL